ncbi:hypothetical protein SCH01S_15_00270 [Sphingomonas changbaiensis NBRC 104936]|uniref:Uncharacterized protein n=1 Tax=Sphingomonas changbaiensis NBRC 104936 TaxID=1219043 RepID=A0A0E9MKV7_9SPHN|nr:hypothetical protein SCH01S_15_00270 [Sphingomonas changbaiensis NBRC 104936]
MIGGKWPSSSEIAGQPQQRPKEAEHERGLAAQKSQANRNRTWTGSWSQMGLAAQKSQANRNGFFVPDWPG